MPCYHLRLDGRTESSIHGPLHYSLEIRDKFDSLVLEVCNVIPLRFAQLEQFLMPQFQLIQLSLKISYTIVLPLAVCSLCSTVLLTPPLKHHEQASKADTSTY